MSEQMIDENEAAAFLKVSPRTLQAWRYASNAVVGPRYVKVGRAVRYKPEDLEQWIAARGQG